MNGLKPQVVALATLLMVTGCSALNGFSDAKSNYACKAPDGVSCTSVSGVYANAQANNLPGLKTYRQAALPAGTVAVAGSVQNIPLAMPGLPIRSQSRTLRVWVAPWVDDDGDLHDQSYLYVVIDPGKWLVEHSRQATVKRSLTQLQPLGKPNVAAQTRPSATDGGQAYNPQADAQDAAVVPQGMEQSK